jgi:hypothetical protein
MKQRNPSLVDYDAQEQLGVLKRERPVRLLNSSVAGCLIETNWPLQVGTIAALRVVIKGRELTDDVQITRCQLIAGAGGTFHVGVQFLWTQPLHKQSLRRAHCSPSTIAMA